MWPLSTRWLLSTTACGSPWGAASAAQSRASWSEEGGSSLLAQRWRPAGCSFSCCMPCGLGSLLFHKSGACRLPAHVHELLVIHKEYRYQNVFRDACKQALQCYQRAFQCC